MPALVRVGGWGVGGVGTPESGLGTGLQRILTSTTNHNPNTTRGTLVLDLSVVITSLPPAFLRQYQRSSSTATPGAVVAAAAAAQQEQQQQQLASLPAQPFALGTGGSNSSAVSR